MLKTIFMIIFDISRSNYPYEHHLTSFASFDYHTLNSSANVAILYLSGLTFRNSTYRWRLAEIGSKKRGFRQYQRKPTCKRSSW